MTQQQDLLKRALQIIEENPAGLLSTVDFLGTPHTRWMVGVHEGVGGQARSRPR